MTQFARPASDISVGSWTDEGSSFNDGSLYTSIREVTQDGDISYIDCPNGGGLAEVKLSSVTDPVIGTGHIVHVYGMSVGSGGPEKINAWLYEGPSTEIATIASSWAPGRAGYVDLNYELSSTEADSISDYSDLRVRMYEGAVGSGEHFKITQIYLEVPDVSSTLSFSNLGVSANPDINNSTNATSYATSSWTPPTSGVILCSLHWRQTGVVNEKPEITGNGITWHLITFEDNGNSTYGTALYAAFASGSSAGVTTIDFLGRLSTHLSASFVGVTGVYTSGNIQDVFVQIKKGVGTATSGSITMPTAASSLDRPFAAFTHLANEATTPRTNWTEADDLAGSGANRGLETQYRSAAMETTASATWTSNVNWSGIAVELREATVTTGLSDLGQAYWRVRSGDTVGLNVDSGWAAAENTQATILQGVNFRVRVKVRRATTGAGQIFNLQARHVPASGNGSGWADASVLATGLGDGPIAGKLSTQYADGAATTELLTGPSTWQAGEGIETVNLTGNTLTGTHDLDNEETEFEWCIQIVSSYSDLWQREITPGDMIYLRVVQSDGTAFPNLYNEVAILVAQNDGYVGRTYTEKPGRVLVADTNGNLYYLCEGTESAAQTYMAKSTDRGKTWAFIDRAGRPAETDLESTDIHQIGDTLHIGSQLNNDAFYDVFYTSDHATLADTWGTQETVKTPVTRDDQVAAIAVRSDGSQIVFFEELVSTYQRITYRIKNGTWSADNNLDSQATTHFSDVMAIVGDSDLTHVFYVDLSNGKLYHNTISSTDVLGTREEIGSSLLGTGGSDENPIAGVVRYDSSGVDRIVVAFKGADDRLQVAKVDDNGSPSAATVVSDVDIYWDPPNTGSDMPVADIGVDGDQLYVVYADITDHDLYITHSDDYGTWDTDVEFLDGVDPSFLRACRFDYGSGSYFGIIYEEASNGGYGQGWYAEYEAPSGGDTFAPLAGNLRKRRFQPLLVR